MRSAASAFLKGNKLGRLVISVMVAFVGYGVWSFWIGATNVVASVSKIPYLSYLLAITLLGFSLILRFFRWQLLLRELGHRIPPRRAIVIYIAGFSLTTTPGKAGELIRGSLLVDYDVPQRDNVVSFLGERLLDFVVLTLLASLIILNVAHGIVYLLVQVLLIVTVVLVIRYFPGKERYQGSTFIQRVMRLVAHTIDGLRVFRRPSILFQTLLLSAVAWISLGGVLWVFVKPFAVNDISIALVISIYASALLIGVLSLLPGGLGATELGMSALLVSLGISGNDVFVSVFLTRLVCLWIVVALGVIAVLLHRAIR